MYKTVFDEMSSRNVWTLREGQSAAGCIQRSCLTFPSGANVVLASLYSFMRGLSMSWHTRRVSVSTRADVKWCSDMLRKNMGKGYFAYDLF